FPDENCGTGQHACAAAVRGDPHDLRDDHLDKLVFYLQVLAVPARRGGDDAAIERGELLFARIGCASCHVPLQRTAADASPRQLAAQSFMPYTDLLLHDMGEGLA